MSLSELGSLGEFVGSIAVFVTLIYLALQIRQNTNAIKGANEKQMTDDIQEWVKQIVSDDELRDIWHRMAIGQPINAQESLRLLWLMVYWFNMCEGWYRLHQRNLISQQAWEARLTEAIANLQHPLIDEWWRTKAASLSKDFRTYIEEHRDDEALAWSLQNSATLIKRLTADDSL